jgi:hypothetical protein
MELARTKWQIYFSHLPERPDWTIRLMMKKRKVAKNKGDNDDQFKADVKKSGKKWEEGNVGVYVQKIPAAKQNANSAAAEQCGVDESEGE